MGDAQKRVRRRFTAQQKVAILKEHLVEKAAVSQVCDKHARNPTAFYRWQKEFFENGPAAFESRRSAGDAKSRRLKERVEKLAAKLARKDEVIAELMEGHVRLKKVLGRTEWVRTCCVFLVLLYWVQRGSARRRCISRFVRRLTCTRRLAPVFLRGDEEWFLQGRGSTVFTSLH